ncbi:MAG: hypothetical protein KC417_03450, partial [Myxococcales bacterium]|nr:hypothetical protein [Myxococcales bacterium]
MDGDPTEWTLRRAAIDSQWKEARPWIAAYAADYSRGPQRLYDTQVLVSNFVSLASQKGDKRWLLDLLGIHQFAATHLETTSSISMRRVGTTHLSRPMRLWKNSEEQEIVLSSAQFLYAVSMLLHDAAAVDGVRGTEESERFLETYLDVVVRDHLFRWIWNRDADAGSFGGRWDCEPTTLYSHAEFVERLIS